MDAREIQGSSVLFSALAPVLVAFIPACSASTEASATTQQPTDSALLPDTSVAADTLQIRDSTGLDTVLVDAHSDLANEVSVADSNTNADAKTVGDSASIDSTGPDSVVFDSTNVDITASEAEVAVDSAMTDTASSTMLAATPPMGWNNFNYFVDNFTYLTFEQTADALVSNGLSTLGYQYVNIDDSWDNTARDANGNLVPNPTKFPNGITPVADYMHARGLKLGIYADRGVKTCSGYPGSYGHEAQDAARSASWGVDFVKVDNCFPNTGTTTAADQSLMGGTVDGVVPSTRYQTAQLTDYTNWRTAMNNAGRPMIFSICAWWSYPWEPTLGNMFRTTKDIKDNWTAFLATLDGNGGDTQRYTDANYPPPGISSYAGPGQFNDPDMLEVGNSGMTAVEQQAQFSLWAIMAAPLILGNDLMTMSSTTLAIISNAEVIAIDQDPLGKARSTH